MKVVTVLGTRPELIRLSLVIERLDALCDHVVVHTGQNDAANLRDVFFTELGIRQPQHSFEAGAQRGMAQVGAILAGCERILLEERPHRLLVLGDTNSALAALAAKRLGIPVYHMEAGNRCFDDRVPEEVNRRVVDHASDILMPYTERSRAHLLREGIHPARIFVTGNPITEVLERHRAAITERAILGELGLTPGGYFLVTLHRAENVDDPTRLARYLASFAAVAEAYQMPLVWPVHPRSRDKLRGQPALAEERLRLVAPLGLFDFVHLEQRAHCILTDSGTVQEEACLFRTPSVTIRDVTERAETVETGSAVLSGAEPTDVLRCVRTALACGRNWPIPSEYALRPVADTVAKIVLGLQPGVGI